MISPIPLSPVPGRNLEAYASQLVVHPGDEVQLMASGSGQADLEVTRLIHGDPNPDGPGYRDNPVDWGAPGFVELVERTVDYGSYIVVPDFGKVERDLTFCAWLRPTLLNASWNTIAAQWGPREISFGVFGAGKTLTAGVSTDGSSVEWVVAKEFLYPHVWQLVAFTYNAATGMARLYQHFRSEHRRATPHDLVVSEQQLTGGRLHPSRASLYLGALPPVHPGQVGHWAHFNGKIGSPLVAAEELDAGQVTSLCEGNDIDTSLLARWDLSQEVDRERVIDVSARQRHGRAVNLPARAVTGVTYDRTSRYVREGSYSRAPASYDAVHLHEDDLDDAGWEPSITVRVPESATPGIYALKLSTSRDRVFTPVVVSTRRPQKPLTVLLPTLTWTAYASNRLPYSYTRDGVLDRGNSLYTVHADGSPVYYVTRRRPTRAYDPTAGFEQRGAHKITANLYLIDWLEQQNLEYDITTDDDLDERGLEALGRCRCLLVGSHPEYWTPRMLAAFEEYLSGGGRVLYMGAEFLLWIATIDRSRRHVMEVRKTEGGDYHPVLLRPQGEAEHSTEAILGGAWAERGRHARNLIGVEVAAQAWSPPIGGNGFVRTQEAATPACRWVFNGVDEDPIGAFGLNFGSAAWMEMDGALPGESMAGVDRRLLATSRHPDFWSPMAEMPSADLVLSSLPNGGAVFAAGSLTWTGSLSHNGYDNGISRITRNVIDRFVERPAGESVLD